MKSNPDIIKDFSRLQADVAALSKTNVELVNENMKLKDRIENFRSSLNTIRFMASEQQDIYKIADEALTKIVL